MARDEYPSYPLIYGMTLLNDSEKTAQSDLDSPGSSNFDESLDKNQNFKQITLLCSGSAIIICILGIIGINLDIPLLSSFWSGYKTIAYSAAITWAFLGLVIVIHTLRPVHTAIRNILYAALVLITLSSILEFILNIQGEHFFFENWLNALILDSPLSPSTPISPIAALLFIPVSLGILGLLLKTQLGMKAMSPDLTEGESFSCKDMCERISSLSDLTGILGSITIIVSFIFILSYVYGAPFFYGTSFIPIAAPSALSGFLVGTSILTSVGRSNFPLSLVSGPSVRSQLLRTFLPLTASIILVLSLLEIGFSSFFKTYGVMLLALFLVLFTFVTSLIVGRVSVNISNRIEAAELERKRAEEALIQSNEALQAAYEEISSSEEELKHNYEELLEKEAELHLALEDLKQSEIKFHSLFETMQEGVILHEIVYDTFNKPIDYRIVDLNPAFTTHTGISVENARGRLASDLYQVNPAPYLDLYATIADTRESTSFETHFEPMGKYFLISVFSPKRGWFATVFTDISERKEMEAKIKEKTDQLDRFFAVNLDLLGIADTSGHFRFLNQAFEKTLGFTKEKLMAEPFLSFVHPEDQESTLVATAVLADKKEVVNFANRYRCKDGSYRWLEWCSIPYGDMIYSAARDITDRKLAEEVMRIMNRDLILETKKAQSYFDIADSLLIILDRVGIVTLINQRGSEILGLPKHEIIGKNWFTTFLPEQLMENVLNVFLELMAGRVESVEYYENPVLTVSGEERLLAWHNSLLTDESGNILGLLSSAEDITDRRLAEEEREELIHELEVKNTELERFVYTVSHDLKSPLITIQGFVGYLEKDAKNNDIPNITDDIRRIRNATEKMSTLLNDLLELSRIGRMVNPSVMIQLSDLAQEAAELVSGQLDNVQVKLIVSEKLPMVFGDRTRLLEVLTNLIENAAKFMGAQESPMIEIGARYQDNAPIFYVKDNGIGIEPQYHTKVFGLFEKLSNKGEGTGIGLAIVKRIIELHNGRIWIESEPERGSTFCFTLPSSES